jgi:tetratricopeptide (TPR) repeat protein
LDDALREFTKAIEYSKTNGEYYYNRATIYGKMKNFKDAIKNYDKAIEYDAGSSSKTDNDIKYSAKYYKGIAHRKLGEYSQSILVLKEAVESKADSPDAHNNLGLSYFE